MTTQSHATRCIALVQLETALRLYFEREDCFSVITLAANAEEIFGKIVTAKGIDNSLETKKKNVDAMHRYLYGSAFPESEIAGRANFAKNAMKHGIGMNPTVTLDAQEEARDMLNCAIDNYWTLEQWLTPAMKMFQCEGTGV